MSQTVQLFFQFLKNLTKFRMNVRKISIFTLALILLYIFILFNKNQQSSDLKVVQYTDRLLRKNTSLGTRLRRIHEIVFKQDSPKTMEQTTQQGKSARTKSTNQVEARVLLLYDSSAAQTARGLMVILDSLRVPVDAVKYRVDKSLPLFTKNQHSQVIGRYSLLMFVDYLSFFTRWSADLRHNLTDYSQKFNITSILFPLNLKDSKNHPSPLLLSYKGFSPMLINKTQIQQVYVEPFLGHYYSKAPISLPSTMVHSSEPWYVFRSSLSPDVQRRRTGMEKQANCTQTHTTCHAMFEIGSYTKKWEEICRISYNNFGDLAPSVLIDRDGPAKIFVGSPLNFWLTKILLMDFMRIYSVNELLRFDRRRWVMIDIDDMFVAPEGLKMNKEDVQALIKTQEKLRKYVPDLTFNLGFCGRYFNRGTSAEVEGSMELVRHADKFQWFGHIYNHLQPHLLSRDTLLQLMHLNQEFARNNSILVDSSYSVSPHHSGVYPVYPPLYQAWQTVWNVTMTTTEEYPRLYPEHMRRGFIHRGIMVLPRQTCKLFTHTVSYETFPGGMQALHDAGNGGSVFNTILSNPISIFMTHVSNYATDRLALKLFTDLFEFTQSWTNLQLVTEQPLNLGKRYFTIFPEDKTPLWESPCRHKRHREIYPPAWNCTQLPSFLILGPQKSGTTALHSFLKQHPQIASNQNTQDHYEEVQFFSNETLYGYGVKWYMDQFQYPKFNNQILFEKSATYLTHPLAPKRVKALLPDVKLIVILLDPVKRAYSWYQHMRAHSDPVALQYTFSQVIRYTNTTDRGLSSLRQRCLVPGEYHKHLQLWLAYFPPQQLLLIDGGQLVEDPAVVMETVQKFVGVTSIVDYSVKLKWYPKKGFYCLRDHCLGPGKGRHYPPLDSRDIEYLEQFYMESAHQLVQILKKIKARSPKWLKKYR